ncbi:hypothetical protein ACFXB3_13025 [Streptomyces sp. NPDC059447]
MADEQEVEAAAEPAPEKKSVAKTGTQKLETKHIQGQVITHTIVKPLPE